MSKLYTIFFEHSVVIWLKGKRDYKPITPRSPLAYKLRVIYVDLSTRKKSLQKFCNKSSNDQLLLIVVKGPGQMRSVCMKTTHCTNSLCD